MIDDYISGLKTNLYLKTLDHCKTWDNQSPKVQPHQKGKPVPDVGVHLPNFGQFKRSKEELVAKRKVKMVHQGDPQFSSLMVREINCKNIIRKIMIDDSSRSGKIKCGLNNEFEALVLNSIFVSKLYCVSIRPIFEHQQIIIEQRIH